MVKIWYEDFSILFNKKFLFEILPHEGLSMNRKMNAIMRFSIYYTLILYLMDTKKNIILIPIIAGIFTYVMRSRSEGLYDDEDDNKLSKLFNFDNKLVDEQCKMPTKNNPFMNPILTDKPSDYNVKSCNSFNNKKVQRNIEENFNEDIFMDVNDVFQKNNGQRQFYTVPGNTIPNDQDKFAKWCYGRPPTCKEGNKVQCLSGIQEYIGQPGTISS